MHLSLSVEIERWPIAGSFSISRGAKTEAQVVVAEINDGRHRGRGECVPYARYDETVAGVMAALGAYGDGEGQRHDAVPKTKRARHSSAPAPIQFVVRYSPKRPEAWASMV